MVQEELNMATHQQKNDHPEEPGRKEHEREDRRPGDDACRCKETSEMRPRELLRLMLSDLTFWKKTKKG